MVQGDSWGETGPSRAQQQHSWLWDQEIQSVQSGPHSSFLVLCLYLLSQTKHCVYISCPVWQLFTSELWSECSVGTNMFVFARAETLCRLLLVLFISLFIHFYYYYWDYYSQHMCNITLWELTGWKQEALCDTVINEATASMKCCSYFTLCLESSGLQTFLNQSQLCVLLGHHINIYVAHWNDRNIWTCETSTTWRKNVCLSDLTLSKSSLFSC